MELIAWFSRFLSDLKYADNSPTPPVQWMTVGSPETTSTLSNLTIRKNDLRVSRRLLYGVSMTKAAAMALVLMLRITKANVAILENMLNIKASIWLLSAFVGQVTLRCWDLQGIRAGFYTLDMALWHNIFLSLTSPRASWLWDIFLPDESNEAAVLLRAVQKWTTCAISRGTMHENCTWWTMRMSNLGISQGRN